MRNSYSEIRRINEIVNAFATDNHISADVRRACNVVLDELLNNIISYAFPQGGDHEIEFRIELTSRRLILTLSDDGVPFNPFSHEPPDTSLPLEEREIGGLGIELVRTLMDDFSYERDCNRNIVTLVKTV